jgi:hypothetical protein
MNPIDDDEEEDAPEEWLYQIFEMASQNKKASSRQPRPTLLRRRTAAKAELRVTRGGR